MLFILGFVELLLIVMQLWVCCELLVKQNNVSLKKKRNYEEGKQWSIWAL